MEEIKESNYVFFTREVASNIIGGLLVITDKKTGIRIAFPDLPTDRLLFDKDVLQFLEAAERWV